MNLSVIPPQRLKDNVKRWLLETLELPNFNNTRQLPISFYAFKDDGSPVHVYPGYWGTDFSSYYTVGRDPGAESGLSVFDKLIILIQVASYTRIANDEDVANAITTAFGKTVMNGFNSLFQGLIYSNEPVLKLAIAGDGRTAVEFENNPGWYGPTGAPVEVGEGWNIITAAEPNLAAETATL